MAAQRPALLKLLIEDQDDLALVSGLLQDGLLVVQDMQFDPSAQSFIAIFSRFMWEAAPNRETKGSSAEGTDSDATAPGVGTAVAVDGDARFEDVPADSQAAYYRVHSAFRVEGATAAKTQRLPSDRKANLNLLSLTQPDPQTLLLTFSEGVGIQLAIQGLRAALEDLGEPWPTLYRPDHDPAGSEANTAVGADTGAQNRPA